MEPNQVERKFGASFRRDLDCWIVYEGTGETELCRCSWDKVDDILSLLRATAAISAMPDSHTLGWNAAIEAAAAKAKTHPMRFAGQTEAIVRETLSHAITALKKPTN